MENSLALAKQQDLYPPQPVLIVDDDRDLVESISIALNLEGINNLKPCFKCRELEDRLVQNNYSAIIIDLGSAQISGYDLLDRILEEYKNLIVILILSSDRSECAEYFLKLGVFDYLVKPLDKNMLALCVKRALDFFQQKTQLRVGEETKAGAVRPNARAEHESGKIPDSEKKVIEAYLEVSGNMAAHISHDINNMVSAFNGYLSLIQLYAEALPKEVKEFLKEIKAAVERTDLLSQSISELKRFKKSSAVLSLNRTLDELRKDLQTELGLGIELHMSLRATHDEIKIQFAELLKLIEVLVSNARESMLVGGGICEITTSNNQQNELVLTIKDSGLGIKRQDMTQVFKPYFSTTKRKGGLGLSIAYTIAKNAGADLRLVSREGEGTMVSLYFPTVSQQNLH